jgi:hypothetical protein
MSSTCCSVDVPTRYPPSAPPWPVASGVTRVERIEYGHTGCLASKSVPSTIDLSQLVDVLRIVAKQETVIISEKVDLAATDPSLVAIVAAKNIVFGDRGAIHHGSTAVLLIANHLEFVNKGKGRVVAWGDSQAHSVVGQPATDGAPAGDVRFVVLGDIVGDSKGHSIDIDSYGQLGSAGGQGRDGTPRDENDRPNIKDKNKATIPPLWSFRSYGRDELDAAKERINSEITKTVNGDQLQRLRGALSSIDECLKSRTAGSKSPCVAPLCDEPTKVPKGSSALPDALWSSRSTGEKGFPGKEGEMGERGGNSGSPGRVYITVPNADLRSYFLWTDGSPIDTRPPPLAGAPGGKRGNPGPGGRGGPGADGDVLHACPNGIEGDKGDPGPTRIDLGPKGSDRASPVEATIQIQDLSSM